MFLCHSARASINTVLAGRGRPGAGILGEGKTMTGQGSVGSGQQPLPQREFAMLFTSTPQGASLARRIMLKRLKWWGIDHDIPALLIGELAANAVTHCRSGCEDFFLRIAVHGRTLRIEVADKCRDERPVVVKPSDDCESGRGMLLVDALATAWGVAERAGSKTVWCECAAHPSPESRATMLW